jgi:hypothetical protein
MKKTLFKKIKSAFIFWLARRLPDCKTMTPTLSRSLDRRLSRREKIVTRLHLFTCTACTRYLKQIKFLSDAMHKHEEILIKPDDLSPAQMSAEAKKKLKNALKSVQILAI